MKPKTKKDFKRLAKSIIKNLPVLKDTPELGLKVISNKNIN